MDGRRLAATFATLALAALGMGARAEVVRVQRCEAEMADGSSPQRVAIELTDERARDVAPLVARAAGVRIDGMERLAEARITLNFACVEAGTIVAILASESKLPPLREGRDHYAFGTAGQFAALAAIELRVSTAREGGDDAALFSALREYVDAVPMPTSGPAMDVADELDEAARLAALLAWLEREPRCLLVLAAPEPTVADERLERILHRSAGPVLVCGLLKQNTSAITELTVPPLDLDEALALAVGISGRHRLLRGEAQAAHEVVEALGRLPAPIQLVAGEVAAHGLTWLQCRDELRAQAVTRSRKESEAGEASEADGGPAAGASR